jgi:hypothetical protein
MVDPIITHGKRLAMIAWGKNEDGSDDVAVFTGVAEWDGTALRMRREPESSSFKIPSEWLSRLQPVRDDMRPTLLDAEYSFSVTVGNLDLMAKTLRSSGRPVYAGQVSIELANMALQADDHLPRFARSAARR